MAVLRVRFEPGAGRNEILLMEGEEPSDSPDNVLEEIGELIDGALNGQKFFADPDEWDPEATIAASVPPGTLVGLAGRDDRLGKLAGRRLIDRVRDPYGWWYSDWLPRSVGILASRGLLTRADVAALLTHDDRSVREAAIAAIGKT